MRHAILLFIFLFTAISSAFTQQMAWRKYDAKTVLNIGSISFDDNGVLTIVYEHTNVDTARTDSGRFQKTVIKKEIRTFSRTSVNTEITHELQLLFSPDSVHTLHSKLGGISDSISFPANGTDKVHTSGESPVYHYSNDTFLTYANRRALYDYNYNRKYVNPRFFAGVTIAPLISYRIVFVNQPSFTDNATLERRQRNEFARMGYLISVPIGIAKGRYSRWYFELIKSQEGFKSVGYDLDWSTGLPNENSGTTNYRFNSWGWGLGYSRSDYHRTANLLFDGGLSMRYLNAYRQDGKKQSEHLHNALVVGKVGMGVNVRLKNSSSLRIVPSAFYHFRTLSKEILATRLMTYGLLIGYTYEYKKYLATDRRKRKK